MKKTILTSAALLLLTTAPTVYGVEFKPLGTLGIGGAGVARTHDAYAPYWNPAGLAFNEHKVSVKANTGAGLRLNNGLAEDLDRLDKIDYNNLKTFNPADPNARQKLGDTVQLLGVLKTMDSRKGGMTVDGNAVLGAQIGRFGFGAFGSLEAAGQPSPDTVNIIPQDGATGVTISQGQFASSFSGSAASNRFFTAPQRADITTAFQANGFTAGQAADILNGMDAQLASSNIAGTTSPEAAAALVDLAKANYGGTYKDNATSVRTKGLLYIEVPLSYGHPFDLGSYGTLGVGATVKLIKGRVYTSTVQVVKDNQNSNDVISKVLDNYKDGTSWGIDLGLLWRYGKELNFGLVAKNLNSPSFTSREGDVLEIEPQVRAGVAWDALSWLTLAADLDLTENETFFPGYSTRNLGGGADIHPLTWLKIRLGAYQNLANSEIGPVGTAGLTIGTKWVNLDIDGAAAFSTAKHRDHDYPKEAKVQANLNIQF